MKTREYTHNISGYLKNKMDRRKPVYTSETRRSSEIPYAPTSVSAAPSSSAAVAEPSPAKGKEAQETSGKVVPEFKYGATLFLPLIPPLLVILAFCGRLSLLVFSFGSLAAYFFDLLSSIEVTNTKPLSILNLNYNF